MKITNIEIEKFRWFQKVWFNTGKLLTIIAWQNGTQKTTLLGMLTQPFSITDPMNPMNGERPLSWWNFVSNFADKFRLSHGIYDKVGEHEWTLNFDDGTNPYIANSIPRSATTWEIRFWRKWTKAKGSGYEQIPVIYLSLKRLLPIGEDLKIKEDSSMLLTEDEFRFYSEWHNKILILTRAKDTIITSSIISGSEKQTIGANTSYYDWQTNSAWQDNIWKILLAIISFRRLLERYPNDYKGWILAIDEVDTTFYPWSQIELLKALIKFAKDYDIQIFLTTHSLTLLKQTADILKNPRISDSIKLIYLKKEDSSISIDEFSDYSFIENHLNTVTTWSIKRKKIDVYAEDAEAAHFMKSLLWNSITKHLKFIDVTLSCSHLEQLSVRKIPSFTFPNSIIVLDGDSKTAKRERIKNLRFLPASHSPEQLLSDFLYNLPCSSPLWTEIDPTFSHQVCFRDITYEEIHNWRWEIKARIMAKDWYNSHVHLWWRNASKVWNYWKYENMESVNNFKSEIEWLVAQIHNA